MNFSAELTQVLQNAVFVTFGARDDLHADKVLIDCEIGGHYALADTAEKAFEKAKAMYDASKK